AIRPGIFAQGAEVLWAEVKIAAGGNLQPVAELRQQLLSELADMGEIKPKFVIGVWSCHNVRDAFGDCCFRHGQRFFHGIGAIIEPRKDVTMYIDHRILRPLAPPGAGRLPRATCEQDACNYLPHPSRLVNFVQSSTYDPAKEPS